MSNRKELTSDQQIFVVKALACFKSPSEVVRLVKEEFGISIERQNVRHYIPEQSPSLAAELVTLYHETRKQFIDATAAIGVAHQTYRLAEIQDLYVRAKLANNPVQAANLLKQAAEEVGGHFTNRQHHEITGKNGKDLVPILNVTLNAEPGPAKEADDRVSESGD